MKKSLPPNSPELNPAELVFAFVKNFLHKYRKSNDDLLESIVYSFSKITSQQLLKVYGHCATL